MSFTLVNPTGWTTGDLLTEDQINQLDAEHAAAIDGSNGGSYTLSNPLNITGDTVTFTAIVSPSANIDYVVAPDALIGDLIVTTSALLPETATTVPNSNTTVDIRDYRHVYIGSNVDVTREYTFTGANTIGEWFVVMNASPEQQKIKLPDGSSFIFLDVQVGRKYIKTGSGWLGAFTWFAGGYA